LVGVSHPSPPRISAIVPTLDEEAGVGRIVAQLRVEADEVIVVDGGSRDRTRDRARAAGARVIEAPSGRGPQMNSAAAVAIGDLFWFVHADAGVPEGSGAALRLASGQGRWGCFEVRVHSDDPRLRFTGAWMNRRARRSGACSGDMAIWFERSAFFELGGFATSARRWEQEGVNRTVVRLWALRLAYRLGADPRSLSLRYQRRPR
jgi:glycosyltransferase involved in cell wall biosynthesis